MHIIQSCGSSSVLTRATARTLLHHSVMKFRIISTVSLALPPFTILCFSFVFTVSLHHQNFFCNFLLQFSYRSVLCQIIELDFAHIYNLLKTMKNIFTWLPLRKLNCFLDKYKSVLLYISRSILRLRVPFGINYGPVLPPQPQVLAHCSTIES